MKEIIIAIDHGNLQMKTMNYVFYSSYIESKYSPSIGGADVLRYEDKVYILTDESLPVLIDKTENERYFILTLFAIAKELGNRAELVRRLTPHVPIKVKLLIGLPLQHFEKYRESFEQYFTSRSDIIEYNLNGELYRIQIAGVHSFPQAYAAAISAYDKLKDTKIVNIVDVGGFTVDCLQLNQFNPNIALCKTIYGGVHNLFQSINDQIRGAGRNDIQNDIIQRILEKEEHALSEYSENRINTITSTAETHVNRMLAEIAQKGFDLEEDRTVFMGGGSILLEEYIRKADKAKKPVFVDDVHANAKGYRLLYNMEHNNAGKQSYGA